MVSPHAQEVEFALILSKMINTVKEDPSQMRLAIYEFARARLKLDASWADEPERKRLATALETAIQGVEQFSTRHGDKDLLSPPAPSAQIGLGGSPPEPPSTSMVPNQLNALPNGSLVPNEIYLQPEAEPVAEAPTRRRASTPVRPWSGIVLVGVVAGFAVYRPHSGSKFLSPTALGHKAGCSTAGSDPFNLPWLP